MDLSTNNYFGGKEAYGLSYISSFAIEIITRNEYLMRWSMTG